MNRINTEMAVFACGFLCGGSAIVSTEVFNAGIALPIGTLLLVVSFILGLTQMPFAAEDRFWRQFILVAEFLSSVAASLILFGVISL